MTEKKSVEELPEAEPAAETPSTPPPSTSREPDVKESETDAKQPENAAKDADQDTTEEEQFYTIDDVVNAGGYGRFQKFLTFLAGLGWLADAFEVIILSIIGDMLACDWPMQRWKNALLTSVVFLGMTVGAPVFGNFADRYGRRTSLAISMLLLFIFGGSSAASPDYTWMVILRGLMGFALGGIAQGVTLCCEYYPADMRGRAGFYLSYYWSLGTLGVIAAAWLIMSKLENWRIFVFIAAVPALIVFLVMKWYPESARYYLVSNQPKKAVKVLQRLARMNKAKMPEGKLAEVGGDEQRGKIGDLLKPQMRRATLLFWYIWLAIACCYYGIALITPFIIKEGSLLSYSQSHANKSFIEDLTDTMPCEPYTNETYSTLLWTSAAEFPGLLAFTFLVECCSRKVFLGTACLVTAFMMLFLMLEMQPQIALFLVLFVCRALVAGVFQLLFIMTTEVTVIAKPIPSMFVLSGIGALAGIAAFLLPMDTKGIHLHDVIGDIKDDEETDANNDEKIDANKDEKIDANKDEKIDANNDEKIDANNDVKIDVNEQTSQSNNENIKQSL